MKNLIRKISRLICLLVCIVILFLSCACGNKTADNSGEPAAIAAKPRADSEMMAFSREQIKHFAETSGSVWELYQRFFTDIIIYKNRIGDYEYKEVDKSLPLSDYNFDNLVEKGLAGREVEYIEDGITKSIKGIDVSAYQGNIEWDKVAADGVKFAFLRLGYRGYSTGKIVTDERFKEYITGALNNGIAVGVYFVTQAVNTEEAIEEAEYVLDKIRPYNVTWPVVLDLEDAASASARTRLLSSGERTEIIKAFCDRIKEAGYTPMLYANIRWYMDEMDLKELTQYDKWFAQYFNHPFFPYEFTVWQYTSSGHVKGISGNVDMDISFTDYGNLQQE